MAFAEWHDDSPLITSKQTTTTPRRNESGEKKGETKSETWCAVTAWHLSSLLLMATKASALCGALPLHHVASAVPVPFLPALRYSPSLELHVPSLGLLLPLTVLASSPCLPLLLLASACYLPLVPARSSAFSARFAACVFFGVSFVALFCLASCCVCWLCSCLLWLDCC